MAYFRCASGGSGAGATITVTYTSDFYGETITCTHGTKSYSKVATSSGTVEFTVGEEGTWTISCTVSGDTYTTTADVDLTASAELTALPDGETVLPTDDIETWLACAGITDKSYTTLSQVLADSETYNALLGDSNACAYMKRSTTWALATGLVPTMTSATTPSGSVIASSEMSGYEGWHVFDENSATSWVASSGTSGFSISLTYEFASAICAKYAVLTPYYDGNAHIKDYSISGSNDNSAYTPLTSGTLENSSAVQHIDFSNNGTDYKYYRITITTSYTINVAINALQFYGADITTSATAMTTLGKYDYACDTLLSDSTWASAIANSTYYEYVLNTKVPTMTSNTTPSGECSASAVSGSYYPWKAFDGVYNNSADIWFPGSEAGTNAWLAYEFTENVKVEKVGIARAGAGYQPSTIKVDAFDGSDWINLGTFSTTSAGVNTLEYFNLDHAYTNNGYTKYRIVSVEINPNISGAQFIGRASSGAKIHGATNDSFYINVGGTPTTITDPSTLSAGTYTVYSTVAKDPNNLSNDYSKTIRICPNTKEIVVMPDVAELLYWWGYTNFNLEALSTANGWAFDNGFTAPNFNQNDISLIPVGTSASAIGTKASTSKTTLHCVGKSTLTSACVLRSHTSKNINANNYIDTTTVAVSNDAVYTTLSLTQSNLYVDFLAINGASRNGVCYALWLD